VSAPESWENAAGAMLGESPPEHGLAGRLLVLAIPSLAMAGLLAALFTPGEHDVYRRGLIGAALAGVLFSGWIAASVRRFECWTWFLLMPVLAVWTIFVPTAFTVLRPGEAVGIASLAVPTAIWLHYLWSRRRAFWEDAPHRRRPAPPVRRVTDGWREGRMARMAARRTGMPSLAARGRMRKWPRRRASASSGHAIAE
jgi:hypothetical protein